MISQHQLLGIGVETNLLAHSVRHWVAVQVMFQQRHGHNERHQALPVVLDQTRELLLVLTGEVVLEEAYQVLEDVMLRAVGLYLLLGGIQRFSTIVTQ